MSVLADPVDPVRFGPIPSANVSIPLLRLSSAGPVRVLLRPASNVEAPPPPLLKKKP